MARAFIAGALAAHRALPRGSPACLAQLVTNGRTARNSRLAGRPSGRRDGGGGEVLVA